MRHRIITVSREFGSGGREVGKRLAEKLGIAYYDREIITAVAQRSGLAEEYIASVSERGVDTYYPITFGHTFAYASALIDPQVEVMAEQNKLLRSLSEKGDCVIVGRCADVAGADRCGHERRYFKRVVATQRVETDILEMDIFCAGAFSINFI